ncbi:recombinase family protein [Jeotgalibacillus malaysiensis]|uniref:recombinase family protein n=1 Tax=Jeotgalibacillus malaysiensis TaxID=1508404 RepID=UPI00384D3B0B
MKEIKNITDDGIRLPDKILVAAYTRVSTDSEDQLKSYESQKKHYESFCDDKENLILYNVYADEGISGTSSQRASFLSMIYDAGIDYIHKGHKQYDFTASKARESQFSIILVKDTSRFSRNSGDAMKLIAELRYKKVFVFFENANISTMDSDWEFRLGLLFQLAEEESRNQSKRVKWGKKRNIKTYNPSRLPYGYTRNENREIVIVPEEARIVREIFKRIKTDGTHKITIDLNLSFIPTKTGKKWSRDKVTRIVQNTIYYGTATKNKQTKYSITDSRRTKLDESEWVYIENAVEPIVSKEEWIEANEKMNARVQTTKQGDTKGYKAPKNDRYTKKIVCGKCNSNFVRHSNNKMISGEKTRVYMYMCWTRNKQGRTVCDQKGISESVLDNMMSRSETLPILDNIKAHAVKSMLLKHLDYAESALNEIKNGLNKEIDQLEQEIENIENKIMLLDENVVINRFQARIKKNDDLINEKHQIIARLNVQQIEYLKEIVTAKYEEIKQYSKDVQSGKLKKIEVLDRIVVTGEEHVEFFYKLPNYNDEVKKINAVLSDTEFTLDESVGEVKESRAVYYRYQYKQDLYIDEHRAEFEEDWNNHLQ